MSPRSRRTGVRRLACHLHLGVGALATAGQQIWPRSMAPDAASALSRRPDPIRIVPHRVDSDHVGEIAAKIALQDLRMLRYSSHGAIRSHAVTASRTTSR